MTTPSYSHPEQARESRERIKIEMQRRQADAFDVPARDPFAEGVAGLGNKDRRHHTLSDLIESGEYDGIAPPANTGPPQPAPTTRAIECQRCGETFSYTGTSRVKRFCDGCVKGRHNRRRT